MTVVIKDNGKRRLQYDPARLEASLRGHMVGLDIPHDFAEEYIQKTLRQVGNREEIDFKDINTIAINNALELVDQLQGDFGTVDVSLLGNTNFQMVAKRVLLNSLYKRASKNRSYDPDKKYGDFFGLISTLAEKGLYHTNLLEDYSKEELIKAGSLINPDRDQLLTYASLYYMSNRYMVRDKDKGRSIYELPQERFMIIALAVSRLENKETRMEAVENLYTVLSTLQATMATPTFANAGRNEGQFSSCFVLTTEDSLRSIYDDNTDIATLSKNGGGIGIYYGKLRAAGSDIRGHVGVSGGIIGWIRQLNNTAVSVDQLGQRQGAVAVYLDIWHSDIMGFLELRLNTGDLAKRAHEIFTGVCIPDEFMRQVEARGDWFLFDPYHVKRVMGFNLEDFYDNKKLGDKETPNEKDHAWTYHYYKCVDCNELPKQRLKAMDIMKKIMVAQLETGIPYMFYRDTVNRDNPNKHAGMIYSSNLCTEIQQNQSPTEVVSETITTEDGEEIIIVKKKPGDFVVCNLSSLVLNNIIEKGLDNAKDLMNLEFVIKTVARATDNVIDVNNLPVPQAVITNNKYRSIGIGEQGIAALLAKLQIPFDSERAVEFIAKLNEYIMMFLVEASADLAQEKGSYTAFEGSGWNTGEWFESKPRTLDGWDVVIEKARKGMRNAYLRAPAPTGSTSLLAGSTASIEAVYDIVYMDSKKDGSIPVVAPGLDAKSYFFYKPTMFMSYEGQKDLGHMWAVLQNEQRQIWVDQSSSSNIYVADNVQAIHFLRLHLEHWKRGIKTSYYTRSHDASREDTCMSCSS